MVELEISYNMKKQASFFLSFLVLGGLTSCNLPLRPYPVTSGQEVVQQYQTVSAFLTETAEVTPVAVSAPQTIPTQTPKPSFTTRPVVTATKVVKTPVLTPIFTRVAGTSIDQAPVVPCDRAQPARSFDVTVPDDTHFYPGENFSKTWRLVNAGSCVWTREYSVVWFSGIDFGVTREQGLRVDTAQGNSIDVTIDMVAPQSPGTYQSNWKLRNNKGMLFGIGSNGNAPFWVRIVVMPEGTPTASPPPPTPTETPVIYTSGSFGLNPGEMADLDTGELDQAENSDIAFQRSSEKVLLLTPLNDARLAPFGVDEPGMEDCLLAGLSDTSIPLEQFQPGSHFCYRTTKGLPGWISIKALDLKKGQLELEFLTWTVP